MYKGRACLLSRHISMSRYNHLQTLTIMSLMTTFYIHNDNSHHSPNPLCVPLHLPTPLSTCATHSSQPSNSTISLPTACTDSLQSTINNNSCFTQTLNRSLQPYSPNSQCCLRWRFNTTRTSAVSTSRSCRGRERCRMLRDVRLRHLRCSCRQGNRSGSNRNKV